MPFGLATAPLEFTQVAIEFKKLMTMLPIWINIYLDDWLNRGFVRDELWAKNSEPTEYSYLSRLVAKFPKKISIGSVSSVRIFFYLFIFIKRVDWYYTV